MAYHPPYRLIFSLNTTPTSQLEKVVTAIDKEKDLKLWSGIVEKFTSAQSYNLDKR